MNSDFTVIGYAAIQVGAEHIQYFCNTKEACIKAIGDSKTLQCVEIYINKI